MFQHDNEHSNTKHSSKLSKEYLKAFELKKVLKVIVWPSQSLDLNPIELLWDKLDRELRKVLQKEWNAIDPDYQLKKKDRIPKLCAAIIKTKDGYIDEGKF